MNKRTILKEACGKGGPIKDTLKNVGGAIKNVYGKAVSKGKQMIKDRIQAQKNFENRADNSNYYGSSKSFNK